MARIRSIKPDFFTSEAIASLPLSARLTFIGLWTHCDDNGVCLDNPVLINAAVWPLDYGAAPEELTRRTRDDLAHLWQHGLIVRYARDRKRYLFVAGWDEHQKVSHPSKSRFPRPGDDGCEVMTSQYPVSSGPPNGLRTSSRDSPETLVPDLGAGSREQGAGKRFAPPVGEPPAATPTQRSKAITDTYAAAEPMCKWPAVNAIVLKAIQAGRWADCEITDALMRLAKEGRGVTVETLRVELNGLPPFRNNRQSETDAAFDRAMARADAREESYDPARNGHPDPVRQSALPAASD